MSQFMGTHQNRLDAKGRVSIPAAFRAALRLMPPPSGPETSSLVLRPSVNDTCIEVWPTPLFQAMESSLNRFEPMSQSHDYMATALYGDAFPMDADKEGRIVLPDELKNYAGLTDGVTFIGLGRTFHIWQPQAALVRRAKAREWARNNGLAPSNAPPSLPPGMPPTAPTPAPRPAPTPSPVPA